MNITKRLKSKVNITTEDKAIKEVNKTKFLGVIVDTNLNWASHIDNVYKKIYKNVGDISHGLFSNRGSTIDMRYLVSYLFS